MKRTFYNIKNGIQNFWYWREVIWNDRWWDYAFFNIIIKHKLKSMEAKWNRSYSVWALETKSTITYAIEILDEIERLEDTLEIDEAAKAQKVHHLYETFGELLYKTRITKFVHEDENGTHIQEIKGPNIELLWD